MKTIAVLLALASLGVISQVDAHGWLTNPVSRETKGYDDVSGQIGCPVKTPGKSTPYKAGETIDVRYWRNNHIGGFIRWAMVPLGQETKENLDKNVFHYSCRESGSKCLPKGNNTKYAFDGSGDNTISCGDKITLPDWLPAGDYVLQWTYFGAGMSFGNLGWAEAQFRSCADIKLTTKGSKSVAPKCPTFTGGDRVTKLTGSNQSKCFYFLENDIVGQQFKGDNNNYEQYYKFGIPAAVAKCSGGSASNSTTSKPPATTPKAATTTTKAPATAPKPATTTKTPEATSKPAATTKSPILAPTTKAPVPATKTPGCNVKGTSK